LDRIENLCVEKGMRMTDQRRVVARVLSGSQDHPDVEELYRRAHQVDPHISIATVYRTVRLFEEAGIIEKHDFRDGRSRYDDEIEELQQRIARRLGYRLVDHRLELYGVPMKEGEG
jgi:Fur family ferric uptake transcriptional regulator